MPVEAAKKTWRKALLVYRHPRVLAMLFLGFSAGLPFLLIFSTLSVWLREADISRTEIGFFSWIGIMFFCACLPSACSIASMKSINSTGLLLPIADGVNGRESRCCPAGFPCWS